MTPRGAIAFAAGLATAPFAVWAETPVLSLPVDCVLGQTCFVEDYHDSLPATGALQDYTCGLNTRDNHFGTDIALPVWSDGDSAVDVLAAADGRVFAVRDEMPDDWRMRGVTSDRACGNAVVIDHPGGWRSSYCHLALGSVAVRAGDSVTRGQVLGRIGLSGQTTHPHLHFGLRHNGKRVDPFNANGVACGDSGAVSLWDETPEHHATLLRNAGFSNAIPDYDALRGGTARVTRSAPGDALVVYAEAGFAEHGDVLTIRATGPDGQQIFEHSRVFKSPRNSELPAFGRRAPEGGWPRGDYIGQLTLTRQGKLIANRWAHITIE